MSRAKVSLQDIAGRLGVSVKTVSGALHVARETGRGNVLSVDVGGTSLDACLIVGGEPMDGPRYIWWNFVSSSKERIESAKADWKSGRFDKVFGDEQEFIPLPE